LGICPAGGGHDMTGSGDYWIPHNDWKYVYSLLSLLIIFTSLVTNAE
jgi:hypothetical protein